MVPREPGSMQDCVCCDCFRTPANFQVADILVNVEGISENHHYIFSVITK
jgi:hypothetical protein